MAGKKDHPQNGAGTSPPPPPPPFTVDTHLFRELGELLVGRDSTALVELIKNSYDADALDVTVHATSLDDPMNGTIIITDDGLGMTAPQFRSGFLRIASRVKEEGDRRSPRFKRRFTGAKGIGRLAAHKLARNLHVLSVASDPKTHEPIGAVDASIDWVKVESVATLDAIQPDAVTVATPDVTPQSRLGTTITLSQLRRPWSARDIVLFVAEARATRPPNILKDPLPDTVVPKPVLFKKPIVESSHPRSVEADRGWTLELTGDFDVGEDFWQVLAAEAAWVLEIDVTTEAATYKVTPTLRTLKKNPAAEEFQASIPFELKSRASNRKTVKSSQTVESDDDTEEGAEEDLSAVPLAFQGRILIREGSISAGRVKLARDWIHETHGVRIYMEGFRVLPYGEAGDDWLGIDRAYAERSRATDKLSATLFSEEDANLGLVSTPNRQYLGGIFLTSDGASALRMLVNREGFVPDAAFRKLQTLVNAGIGLATRVRAAASAEEREDRRRKRAQKQPSSEEKSRTQEVIDNVSEATHVVTQARAALIAGKHTEARAAIDKLGALFEGTVEATREIADEQAMIRILASLGAQTAGFVHEINGLLGLAQTLEKSINTVRDELDSTQSRRFGGRLGRAATQLSELRLALERQASYLTEIVSPDKRRRRSAQDIGKRFETAQKLIQQHADLNAIEIRNNIADGLRTSPMFGAELVAVFTNLLTNAVKAVGKKGAIRATARELKDGVRFVLENTGTKVNPDGAEKWFRPFTSTTQSADPVLGLGMGLGLPITRRILSEYGATIEFVEPSRDYSAAVEITFKNNR
ncbi:MAG TPA: ATP-binding protein [Kofleriaceae bacterium]|nr:ATP-binding protein [Kofleriaceae bacterium]